MAVCGDAIRVGGAVVCGAADAGEDDVAAGGWVVERVADGAGVFSVGVAGGVSAGAWVIAVECAGPSVGDGWCAGLGVCAATAWVWGFGWR